MRKPEESLADFIVSSSTDIPAEPPSEVWLQSTGEVERLEPLTRPEAPAATLYASRSNAGYQPLWFRALLVGGSGALVMIAIVFVSAIVIGISEPAAGPDVAGNGQPADKLTGTEEQFSFEMFSPSSSAPVTGAIDIVRSKVKRRSAKPSTALATYRSRQLRPLPRPDEPKFVPTTLVIYAENGVINTRIEPWLQTGDRKPSTFNN
jgi:hypothetical protein